MNRSQRRAFERLPTTLHPWEVALVPAPMSVDGVDLEGLLLAIEQGTGKVRVVGPLVRGEPLLSVLGSAFTDPPPPGAPGRPPRILCDDAIFALRLRRELKGVAVEVVDHLPEVTEAFASLQEHLSPVLAPGITEDVDAWRVALRNLVEVAPWEVLPDSVLFHFEGLPGVEAPVAQLLGLARDQFGVVLYPTFTDYHGFQRAMFAGEMEALAEVEAVNLYLDTVDELEPEELEACEALDLALPNGLFPRLMVLAGGRPTLANELAQRSLLATVQAITALTADGPEALLFLPRERRVPTAVGLVRVSTTPPRRPAPSPTLTDAEHAVAVGPMLDPSTGAERLALVVKLRKADAVRLAGRLAKVDALRIVPGPQHATVHALIEGRDIGVLVHIAGHHAAALEAAIEVVLCVASGGPRRPRVMLSDLLMTQEVLVL